MMVNGESFNMLNSPNIARILVLIVSKRLQENLIYLENEITYLRSIAL